MVLVMDGGFSGEWLSPRARDSERGLGNSRTRVVRLAELEIKSVRNVNLTTLDTVLYGTGGCVAEMTSVNVNVKSGCSSTAAPKIYQFGVPKADRRRRQTNSPSAFVGAPSAFVVRLRRLLGGHQGSSSSPAPVARPRRCSGFPSSAPCSPLHRLTFSSEMTSRRTATSWGRRQTWAARG